MHVAAAVGCPTLALFGNDRDGTGASPVRLWAPRSDHVVVLETPHSCGKCEENRFRNADCLVPGHPCMVALAPESVLEALDGLLSSR